MHQSEQIVYHRKHLSILLHCYLWSRRFSSAVRFNHPEVYSVADVLNQVICRKKNCTGERVDFGFQLYNLHNGFSLQHFKK